MKDLAWLRTYKIAHRGLHDENTPENSLAAFKKAIAKGYAIECDIQASLEGEAMVFHDENLKRMTGTSQNIYHLSKEELSNTYLKDTKEGIPSLKEVLSLVGGKVPLLIEIKSESPLVSLTHEVIHILKDYNGDYAIHSFAPKVQSILKKEAPEILRGQISSFYLDNHTLSRFRKWALKTMFFNVFNSPDFVTYHIEDSPNMYLNRFKKKGLIIGYTAQNKKAYKEALNYFDNAVFEGFDF